MRKLCVLAVLMFAAYAGAQQKISGTISAAGATCAVNNACVVLQLYNSQNSSSGGAGITVSANASGNTLQFEGTADGTTWAAINAYPLNSTTAATSTVSTGTWQLNVTGLVAVRVRCSTLVSGTSTIAMQASTASAHLGGGSGPAGIASINGDSTSTTVIAVGSGLTITDNGSGTHTIAAGHFVDSEVVTCAIVTCTALAHTPTTGTTHLYRTGVRQTPTTDYTVSGAVITLVAIPGTDTFLVDYRY